MITLKLGNDAAYATLVHGTHEAPALPQAGDPIVATKDDATLSHKPGLVFSFAVEIDGVKRHAQAVVTVREFVTIYSALRGRYGPGGPEAYRFVGGDSPFIPYSDTAKNDCPCEFCSRGLEAVEGSDDDGTEYWHVLAQDSKTKGIVMYCACTKHAS